MSPPRAPTTNCSSLTAYGRSHVMTIHEGADRGRRTIMVQQSRDVGRQSLLPERHGRGPGRAHPLLLRDAARRVPVVRERAATSCTRSRSSRSSPGRRPLVMVVGDFDLSVGATSSLAGAVTRHRSCSADTRSGVAILAGLVVGLLVGLVERAADRLPQPLGVRRDARDDDLGHRAWRTSSPGGTTLFSLPPEFNDLGQGKFLNDPLAGVLRGRDRGGHLVRAALHDARSAVVRDRRQRRGRRDCRA